MDRRIHFALFITHSLPDTPGVTLPSQSPPCGRFASSDLVYGSDVELITQN